MFQSRGTTRNQGPSEHRFNSSGLASEVPHQRADSCLRRALILEHEREAGAGLLGDWLGRRGFWLKVVRAPEGDLLPAVDGFDLVVILGSARCANDDLPWIAAEAEVIATAHRAAIPVFGVCFGGQLLARVLGGLVVRDQVAEISWTEVDSRNAEVIPVGPWFEWHFDVFEPPEDAEILATSSSGVEAFRLGRSFGIQFHPEVDRKTMEEWVVADPQDLVRAGTDPETLASEIGDDPLDVRTNRLFEGMSQSVGLI